MRLFFAVLLGRAILLWARVVEKVARGGVRVPGPFGVPIRIPDGCLMGDGSSSRLFEVFAPPIWRVDRFVRRLYRRLRGREGAMGKVSISTGYRSPVSVRVVEVDRKRLALPNVPDPDLPTTVSRAMTPDESREMDRLANRWLN